MERINELIDLIYNLQQDKEKQEAIINQAKETSCKLDNEISNYKTELLSLITSDDAINNDGKVAVRMHRPNTSYKDERAIISWLRQNLNGKFIKSKVNESLDKVPFKKELKTNTELAEGVKDYIGSSVTDYVVVTSEENYKKMLEHMETGE